MLLLFMRLCGWTATISLRIDAWKRWSRVLAEWFSIRE